MRQEIPVLVVWMMLTSQQKTLERTRTGSRCMSSELGKRREIYNKVIVLSIMIAVQPESSTVDIHSAIEKAREMRNGAGVIELCVG